MAVLVTDDYTIEQRRQSVRDFTGATSESVTDAEVDLKMLNSDKIALALFATTSMPAGHERNFLTVSNIHAAILLLMGLQEDEVPPNVMRELRKTADGIVLAVNKSNPVQASTTSMEADTIAQGQGDII